MPLEFGSPPRRAGTGFSFVLTVNGSVSAVPDTCGANATISVHVPGAGDEHVQLRAHRVRLDRLALERQLVGRLRLRLAARV